MYNHIAQWISRTSSSCKTEILPIKQSPLYLSLTLVTTFLLLVSVNFTTVSCSVRYFETPWTVACQALLSVGFSRQEYRSGLPFSTPGSVPGRGTKIPQAAWHSEKKQENSIGEWNPGSLHAGRVGLHGLSCRHDRF